MKLARICRRKCGTAGPLGTGHRGVAVIVVLMVLAIMAILLAVNAQVLADLKAHILFLEKKQQKKFVAPAKGKAPDTPQTNAPPRQP